MNAKIAIIEDEPDIRRILRDFLVNNGCTVSEAADGLAASELLAKEQFDLDEDFMSNMKNACMEYLQFENTEVVLEGDED